MPPSPPDITVAPHKCAECHNRLWWNHPQEIYPCRACLAAAVAKRTDDIASKVSGTPTFTGSLTWRFRLRCMLTPDHAIRRAVCTAVTATASAIRKSFPAEEVPRAQE